MRIQCIRHAPFEKSGFIEQWALEKKHDFNKTFIYKQQPLPTLDSFDFLLLMGGPQSPIEMEKYPYLFGEIDLIRRAIDQNKHVLGICLGAQLISEAFGAKTLRSPEREIGVFPITLTQAGQTDPIFRNFPNAFDVGHWHNDMPGLPENATVLASSEGCPHQAIKYNDKTYGLQCHMEFTPQVIGELIENCPGDLTPSRYTQPKETLLSHNYDDINTHLKIFLELFCV